MLIALGTEAGHYGGLISSGLESVNSGRFLLEMRILHVAVLK